MILTENAKNRVGALLSTGNFTYNPFAWDDKVEIFLTAFSDSLKNTSTGCSSAFTTPYEVISRYEFVGANSANVGGQSNKFYEWCFQWSLTPNGDWTLGGSYTRYGPIGQEGTKRKSTVRSRSYFPTVNEKILKKRRKGYKWKVAFVNLHHPMIAAIAKVDWQVETSIMTNATGKWVCLDEQDRIVMVTTKEVVESLMSRNAFKLQ